MDKQQLYVVELIAMDNLISIISIVFQILSMQTAGIVQRHRPEAIKTIYSWLTP